MYITPLYNQTFNGKTRFLSCNSEGKQKTVSDCPFGTANFGETRGLADFVKKHSYPFATVEETVGRYHDEKTYKIYVADPIEKVDDFIKQNHDYIVYDCEPAYPDLKTEFFNSETKDLKQQFKNVHDYLERLEAAELQQGKNINETKSRQKIAELCSETYENCAELLQEKYNLEDKIKIKLNKILQLEHNLPKAKKELETKKFMLSNRNADLNRKLGKMVLYQRKIEMLNKKLRKNPREIEIVEGKIQRYENLIAVLKTKIKNLEEKISYLERSINRIIPETIATNKKDIKNCKDALKEIKKSLQPHYNRLCSVYKKYGINIIHKA